MPEQRRPRKPVLHTDASDLLSSQIRSFFFIRVISLDKLIPFRRDALIALPLLINDDGLKNSIYITKYIKSPVRTEPKSTSSRLRSRSSRGRHSQCKPNLTTQRRRQSRVNCTATRNGFTHIPPPPPSTDPPSVL